MLRKLLGVAVCILALSVAAVAAAQEPATLLLKSGERIKGELVDLNASGLVMRVNGKERSFPVSEAAVLDFSGNASNLPAAELQKAQQGHNLLVLKDGQQVEGKFYDVGGKHPLRITFTVDGKNQDYTSNQVSRIYMAAPSGSAVATSGAQPPAGSAAGATATVHVAANRAWTPTGITVQQGQVINFSASGQVQLSPDANDVAPVTGRMQHAVSARGSLPGQPGGALLGRIGNGRPFGIGDQSTITAPATGPLYLGINDDMFTDNSGEFVVSVTGGTSGTSAIRRR